MARKKKGDKKVAAAGAGSLGLGASSYIAKGGQKYSTKRAGIEKEIAIRSAQTGRKYRTSARRASARADSLRKRSNIYFNAEGQGRTPYGRKLKVRSAKYLDASMKLADRASKYEGYAKGSLQRTKKYIKAAGKFRNIKLATGLGAAGLGAYAIGKYLKNRKKK